MGPITCLKFILWEAELQHSKFTWLLGSNVKEVAEKGSAS